MGFDKNMYMQFIFNREFEKADEYRRSNIPKKLYKFVYLNDVPKCINECEYENVNNRKIKSIVDNKFWVSTYDNLNDPFELKSIFIEEEKIKKYGYPVELVKEVLKIHREYLIGCFTTNLTNNLPMWAHYANNHKGVCVEYKVLSPNFFYPVIYEKGRHLFNKICMNFLSLAFKDMKGIITEEQKNDLELYGQLLFHNTTIKDKSWEYEDEYRYIIPKIAFDNKEIKGGTLLNTTTMGIEISGIYVGMCCEEKYKNRLIEVAKALGIKIYQMCFNDKASDYALDYKEITNN